MKRGVRSALRFRRRDLKILRMARLRDVPSVLRLVGDWAFAKRVSAGISRDFVLTWALARCYGVDAKKCRPYVKQRAMAFGLTVAVAVLVVAVFILIPVGTIVTEWLVKEVERGGVYLSPAKLALLTARQVVRYGLG